MEFVETPIFNNLVCGRGSQFSFSSQFDGRFMLKNWLDCQFKNYGILRSAKDLIDVHIEVTVEQWIWNERLWE